MSRNREPEKFAIRTLHVSVVLGSICAVGFTGCQREAARRMKCNNNLKWIALAMHNYHDVHKSFPPGYVTDKAGKPMHSWRVLLLPYLGEDELAELYNFDEPWDSPGNLAVAERMPNVFRCPSTPKGNLTPYVVVLSERGADGKMNSLFGGDRGARIRDVRDGTANTLAVVETKEPVPWTKPDADLHFNTMDFTINAGPNSIGSNHGSNVANVALSDGSCTQIGGHVSPEQVRGLITPAGGESLGNWLDGGR